MKVTFIGAVHEVTGSRTLIQCGNSKILVDYGMEQGRNEFENIDLPVPPSEIDCVFLTHAHIDHSGHLPLLFKQGFRGKVYSTEATYSLCHIMLLDSAHIQESDAEWKNRKAKRAGRPEVEPLYTVKDAEGVLQLFHTCPYGRRIQVEEGIDIRFQDMGHLLGSSAVEIWLKEGDVEKKIVFSGDVGNTDQPIINDPQPVSEADYVVIESTYGNRNHGPRPDYVESLSKILQETFDRGGNVIIPSFAVGRTQEMLYFLRQIKQQRLVKGHDGFSVYVDSPLANEATRVFLQCHSENFDPEMKALVRQGINPIWSDGLRISVTAEESKAINFDPKPKVILAASGMCDAGRIRHHLKHNLWRKESTVLFVGYQSVGTLGRVLVDGADEVKLFDEKIHVAAQILQLPGISGHADQDGLLAWLRGFNEKPHHVFINHGDDESCKAFRDRIALKYGYEATAPYSGSVYDLARGMYEYEAQGIRLAGKAETQLEMAETKISDKKSAAIYHRLEKAIDQLAEVAKKNRNRSDKELKKFLTQIENLCKQWRH
ncbi:MAG: MBL fold metallo-hydrolase [Lachnospiraceae bacterium]|nr:MBL fold metallo-hydrolase [Lachnospiraceae bacterium]